jgi:CheY-like chemotaxis protein
MLGQRKGLHGHGQADARFELIGEPGDVGTLAPHDVGVVAVQKAYRSNVLALDPRENVIHVHGQHLRGIVPGVPSVTEFRTRVRGWLRREPKQVVPRSILVVDGDRAIRESTARMVERLGYQSIPLTRLSEVVQHLEAEDADFLLLGFHLADGDALEALNQVRELAPELPIVMLTTDLWDPRIAEALRRGAVAYLARPFGLDDLREILGRT